MIVDPQGLTLRWYLEREWERAVAMGLTELDLEAYLDTFRGPDDPYAKSEDTSEQEN